MKKSRLAIIIASLYSVLVGGCSYIEITDASINTYDTHDALTKIELITSFLKTNGFVSEYDPYCTFDVPDLCKPHIHSTFTMWDKNKYHHEYAIGLSMKQNVLYVRGVPARGLLEAPIGFEDRLKIFLGENFHRNEYKLIKSEEPEIFR